MRIDRSSPGHEADACRGKRFEQLLPGLDEVGALVERFNLRRVYCWLLLASLVGVVGGVGALIFKRRHPARLPAQDRRAPRQEYDAVTRAAARVVVTRGMAAGYAPKFVCVQTRQVLAVGGGLWYES